MPRTTPTPEKLKYPPSWTIFWISAWIINQLLNNVHHINDIYVCVFPSHLFNRKSDLKVKLALISKKICYQWSMSMSYTYNETQIWSPRFHPLLPSRSVGGTFRLNLHKMEPWRHWNDFCVHMRISAFSHVHVLKHFKSDPFYSLIMKYGFGRFDCFKLINVRI